MADFSTDFSPAQHAGANTVAPVQVSPVPDFDINPYIQKGLSIFAQLGENAAKRKAEEQSNSVIQQYIQQAGEIADQRVAGTIDASRADTLSRALYQKTLASNPGLIKDLSAAHKELYAGTQTGVIADEVKDQKEREKAADALATEFGFDMSQNMSPETRNARQEAAATMKRAEKVQQRLTAEQSYKHAANAEERQAGEYNQRMRDRETLDQATGLMREMVSTNYDAFSSMIRDAMSMADTPEQVQQASLAINMELSRLKSLVANTPGSSKELMTTYLAPFEDLAKFATSSMKPGVQLEGLKQEVERRMAHAKLLFLQDPQTAAAVAANSLVSNAPEALTKAQTSVTSNIARVTAALPNTPLYKLPQIVGNPGEKATYDATDEAIRNLNSGKVSGDVGKLTSEVQKGMDTYVRQAEAMSKSEDFNPSDLGPMMEFFAKDSVGKAVSSGNITLSQQKAMSTALSAYGESVVKSVTQTLSQAAQDTGQRKSSSVSDYIGDIKFEGGKLTLYPVKGFGSQAGSEAAQSALKKSEAALTRLVRVGAHNDGTTDYGKWWEANRHRVMPNVYADPERFPAGFVNEKTGYKFKGGMWNNPNNWEKVSSGPKQ